MHALVEQLDQAILAILFRPHKQSQVEAQLTETAYGVAEFIQTIGRKNIPEPVNQRLVMLKNLVEESQHSWRKGYDLYRFFGLTCDMYEQRFDYAGYIADYFLHSIGPQPSFEASVQMRLRDMSFLVARLFMVEFDRQKEHPKRLMVCLNVLTLLEQESSPGIKNLLKNAQAPTEIMPQAKGLVQDILRSFENDERHFALTCSLLPTSAEKSETLFISVVQINELIFSLWTEAFRSILGLIDEKKIEGEALVIAERLCQIAQLSISCLAILNDFSHEEFMLFRSSTANAGAIQSRKYKELELYTNRHVQERIAQKAFETLPYLKHLSHYTQLHLYTRLEELPDDEPSRTLRKHIENFEKIFLDWKRFHLHIARSRLLNHGAPNREHLDHYLSSSIRSTFRADPHPAH